MNMVHKRVISGVAAIMMTFSIIQPTYMTFADDNVTKQVYVIPATETLQPDEYLYGRFTYKINDDQQSVTITDCASDVTWVKISGTIDGKLVTEIGDNAFAKCRKLQKVIIGNDIRKIGRGAFAGTNIKEITLPSSVNVIGEKAFANCFDLKKVYIHGDKGRASTLGSNIFKGHAPDMTIYCGTGSSWFTYAWSNKINVIQNAKFWDNLKDLNEFKDTTDDAMKRMKEATDEKVTGNKKPDHANDKKTKKTNTSPSSNKSNNTSKKTNTSSSGSKSNNTSKKTRTTYQDYVNKRKYIKLAPKNIDYSEATYEEKNGGYYFNRSHVFVSKSDYIILCNCVANEYGSSHVPEWEMALVAEVVFNRYGQGYGSLRDVIMCPNQFTGAENYGQLKTFSGSVNSRVINAVNIYCSFPEYFSEGYTQFRGDGVWNYFW